MVFVQFRPFEYVEAYGDSSICVDGIRSLSCSTLRMSHCMVHETYTVNGSYQYALQFQSIHVYMNVHACTHNIIWFEQMKNTDVRMDMF